MLIAAKWALWHRSHSYYIYHCINETNVFALGSKINILCDTQGKHHNGPNLDKFIEINLKKK